MKSNSSRSSKKSHHSSYDNVAATKYEVSSPTSANTDNSNLKHSFTSDLSDQYFDPPLLDDYSGN